MIFILHVATSNISFRLRNIIDDSQYHLSERINIIVKEKAPVGAYFFYLVHQDRQSLNLKYVFVNGVAGFVAKR